MSGFVLNTEMFGRYAIIPTDFSGREHIYKVVSAFESNTWCEVPIKVNSQPVLHNEMQPVLNVIHCGIDETKVVRVALKDCKIKENKSRAGMFRSMSDEEMADAIFSLGCEVTQKISFCRNLESCSEILDNGDSIPEEMCKQCLIEWLQSEVEE